jgi:ankyrin repeat protein
MTKLLAASCLGLLFMLVCQDSLSRTKSFVDSADDSFSSAFVGAKRAASADQAVNEADLRASSEKALKLIQHSQAEWSKKETCTSCHHQLVPEIAFSLARQRGVVVDEKLAREATRNAFSYLLDFDESVQGYDYIDVTFDAWSLVAANLAGVRKSPPLVARALFVASHQLPNGSWHTIDIRPPQSFSDVSTTAICARALQLYMPDSLKGEKRSRLNRAREWLIKAQPRTTEERAFQLFGLLWTEASESVRKNVARQLLSQQREDGGWAELPSLTSDAYSTGEVLAALNEAAGLEANDVRYQRGLQFLMKTQVADGSWHVTSRLHPPAPVSPPYFETGFPYQHDQFISAMGTSWATVAMLLALPEVPTDARQKVEPWPAEKKAYPEWVETALSGSAGDLKKVLDSGIKPDAKTEGGTTLLMVAARDSEKVRLLIDRGADPNARAATGLTPLMAASRYRGNAESVRLLLNKGARPNPDQGVEVRNNATALFFAVMSGDIEVVRALFDGGARQGVPMNLLGRAPIGLMFYAVFCGDPAIVGELITRGCDPNEPDGDGISPIAWTVIGDNLPVFEMLLAKGARVNVVDRFGMTPLLYGVSIDFGNTRTLGKLIGAGADLRARNKSGQTAFDLAKAYNNQAAASLLAGKMAAR